MLLSVRPSFKEGITSINFEMQGRRTEDDRHVLGKPRDDGRVSQRAWTQENVTEDGLHRITMQADVHALCAVGQAWGAQLDAGLAARINRSEAMTRVRRILSEKRRLVVPLVIASLASALLYVVVVFPARPAGGRR